MTTLHFFLTARHWQIFLLFMGIFFAAEFIVLNSMPDPPVTPETFQQAMLPFFLMTVLFMLLVLAWLWTLGEFFWTMVPAALRPDVRWFRGSLVYPLLYVSTALLVFEPDPASVPVGVILPFHLLAMYCMFYDLAFVAKTLRMAESQTAASFYDYSGQFFLLWFFPIGIWVLQPRINRLAAKTVA
jgi:hypothetical protein